MTGISPLNVNLKASNTEQVVSVDEDDAYIKAHGLFFQIFDKEKPYISITLTNLNTETQNLVTNITQSILEKLGVAGCIGNDLILLKLQTKEELTNDSSITLKSKSHGERIICSAYADLRHTHQNMDSELLLGLDNTKPETIKKIRDTLSPLFLELLEIE